MTETHIWTMGNAAKTYCLRWIAAEVERRGEDAPLTILDLGSGTSANFAARFERIEVLEEPQRTFSSFVKGYTYLPVTVQRKAH